LQLQLAACKLITIAIILCIVLVPNVKNPKDKSIRKNPQSWQTSTIKSVQQSTSEI